MRRLLPLLLLVAVLLALLSRGRGGSPARDADASPGPKKLIEMGWDEPDPAFLRAHAAAIDTMPFDGLVYHVPYVLADGSKGSFTWETWGTRVFHEADLAGALRDLEATRLTRVRDNFLRVNATPGTVGWFDDPTPVLANFRLAAQVAKRAGAAGLLFDTEPYKRDLFRYTAQPDTATRSFARYAAQARQRGGQLMRALEEGWPGLTVFLTVGPTWAAEESLWGRQRFERTRYGLLTAFVDGMVLAASDSARIVDGTEAAYPSRTPHELDKYLDLQRRLVLPWITNPARYRKVVSFGLGLWLDHDWTRRGWHVVDPDSNYRTPAALESTLVRAFALSDEYVWLYGERPRWWSPAGGRIELPDAYVEAVRRARRAAGI